ncbi:MAG TPA: LEPR-XLL domain-containing protein, partial [Myxococcota bacterium]|nr:LEPR-XLL domain-containing protein [Myxococcota bacterium]
MKRLTRLWNRRARRAAASRARRAGRASTRSRGAPSRLHLEPLEPRILLAGDPLNELLIETVGLESWTQVGPSQIRFTEEIEAESAAIQGRFGGPVQSVAVHPNGDFAFLGTAGGGVWRTRNLSAGDPFNSEDPFPEDLVQWTAQTSDFPVLSIGHVALSPLDADGNPLDRFTPLDKTVVIAGTGSF